MSHILLAMSGGVDSSVAASLLLEQGQHVSGVYMRHSSQVKPEEENDAIKAAEHLGVTLHRLNIDESFREIVDRFADDYLAGRTPNPCALCNRKIKFGKLIDFADSIGANEFATGHYARIDCDKNGEPAIYRAADPNKDQSYLLYGIERHRLKRIRFPLGELSKAEVRDKAASIGLHVSTKKDSQEICFVEPHKHVAFICNHRPGIDTTGNFVSTDGKILGKHDGFERFTIGQRKGMKVGFGKRIFVIRIEPETKNVVIGSEEELAVNELVAGELNWLADTPMNQPFHCDVKIRYRNAATPAVVVVSENRMEVRFDSPKYGVAPGQIAVCYENDKLLGGGIIQQTSG